MERTATYECPHCGERILMFIDPGDGEEQRVIEDCQVCCRANEITIAYDRRSKSFTVHAVAVDL